MKKYYVFDLIKFILSLLVIQIHIGIFQSYSPLADDFLKNLIGRYAVPMFFTISSYLLFEKINKKDLFSKDNMTIYKNYLKRLLKLYISWTLIYFVFFKFILNYDISFSYYFYSFIFTGFYVHFWFLHAQILGTITFLFLLKKLGLKRTLFTSCIFYITGLILVTYNPILIKVFKLIPIYSGNVLLCRNFLTFALIFIAIGASFSLSKKEGIINKQKLMKKILILSILSGGEFLLLKYIQAPYYALQIIILILTIYIFKLLININLSENKIYTRLRIYSTIIYCSHNLIYLILAKIITINNSLVMYGLTLLTCIIFSEIIMYINKKIINIKFLY